MRRSNTAFLLSLIIHILAIFVFSIIHRGSVERRGVRSIPVELNVEAPEPRLQRKVVEFDQPDMNPEPRDFETRTNRTIKIDKKMEKISAYRDVAVTDDSTDIPGIGTEATGIKSSGGFTLRDGARGAGRGAKGGKSQLVDFVDRSRGQRRIIYCLDVSASMGASNRLNLARNYLKDSLLELDDQKDSFNIIAFSRSAETFFPSNLLPATKENLDSALAFLNKYTPQSIQENQKTNLLGVLLKALEMKPNIIALVTDGLPTAGETNPEKIIQSIRENNLDGSVRIFAIGMEMDLEQPEAWLLRAIAEGNKGEYQFL